MSKSTENLTLPFPIKFGKKIIDNESITLEELNNLIMDYNEEHSLSELKNINNPALRDPDKVLALLEWVSNHHDQMRTVLNDAPFYISNSALPISFTHPVNTQNILEGHFIEIHSDEKNYKSMIKVKGDIKLARENYKNAKISFDKFNNIIQIKEKDLDTEENPQTINKIMDELMYDRHKRYRSLQSMEINAKTLFELTKDFEEDEILEIEDLLEELEVAPLNKH